MTRFWKWLKQCEPVSEQLHWCHVTDGWNLQSIIENGRLSTSKCPVFDEDLSYFFYGRSAYRFNEMDRIAVASRAPVVCIFNNKIEQLGGRIYPFDTGAFESRYKIWMHPKMNIEMFEMPCGDSAPERQVSAFYGCADGYLSMNPITPLINYSGEFEIESLVELIRDPSNEMADDRRLAIELQLETDLDFMPPNLFALIVPDLFLQAEWFNNWANGIGRDVQIKTYKHSPRRLTAHYQSELETITRSFAY